MHNTINLEAMAKWVAALRSGEFVQGFGRMFDTLDKEFCVYGVLAEVYRRETGKGRWDKEGRFIERVGYSSVAYPTPSVLEWLGLNPSSASRKLRFVTIPAQVIMDYSTDEIFVEILDDNKECGVSKLNDHYIPFSQIADLLELTYGSVVELPPTVLDLTQPSDEVYTEISNKL